MVSIVAERVVRNTIPKTPKAIAKAGKIICLKASVKDPNSPEKKLSIKIKPLF